MMRLGSLIEGLDVDGSGKVGGTAEKLINGRYTGAEVVTTFAGVFPMDEPRYVIVCMLDNPKSLPETFGVHTAAWNVAPVVSRVVSRVGPFLGIEPDATRDVNMAEVLPYIHRENGH